MFRQLARIKPELVALYGNKGEVWRYGVEALEHLAYLRDESRASAHIQEAASKLAGEDAEAKAKSRRRK